MLEKALTGSRRYWMWVAFLLLVIGAGFISYLVQYYNGLTVTGMSRNVTWGLYIAQLTFLVGVAASAVMVVLPYYLHNYKAFGKLTIMGEFLAVAAVCMCLLFVVVDLGVPSRMLNLFLHPTPNSILFWDASVLMGYLLLNITIAWTSLSAERKGVPPPKWVKPLIYLSIPWAISIHTVTAFLYNGLSGRSFWLSAILAPRFLASAFAAGPALLIILIFIVRRYTKFDPGDVSVRKLSEIVTYGMLLNVFFLGLELFTVFYSQIPEHMHHFEYLFVGLDGKTALVPWMWGSLAFAAVALTLLINPNTRKKNNTLAVACGAVFLSIWMEKGMGLIVAGFIPSTLGLVLEYSPTAPEVMITLGIYSIGLLILTLLYKVATAVKEEAYVPTKG